MLVEDMSRNKYFLSSFEYHMFYVLYPFVTYLLTLPRLIYFYIYLSLFWKEKYDKFCEEVIAYFPLIR
jgi:uncharacterized membrane protein